MADRMSEEPLYTISIAARLVRREQPAEAPLHPQTLRMYERLGLVRPQRVGKNRLYSDRDIERLRRIQEYTHMGVNLAGVEMILRLLEQMDGMRREMDELREAVRAAAAIQNAGDGGGRGPGSR